jgi:hypothetical protein
MRSVTFGACAVTGRLLFAPSEIIAIRASANKKSPPHRKTLLCFIASPAQCENVGIILSRYFCIGQELEWNK